MNMRERIALKIWDLLEGGYAETNSVFGNKFAYGFSKNGCVQIIDTSILADGCLDELMDPTQGMIDADCFVNSIKIARDGK